MTTARQIIRSATVTAALALLTAACGGGGGGGGQVASLSGHTVTTRDRQASKKSFQDALLDYARCMRAHGVDMPDPTFDDSGDGKTGVMISMGGPGGSKPDPTKFKAAETACHPIMERAEQNMPRPSPEEEAKMRDQALKFARCMREHGVDMPDPTFDGNGRVQVELHAEDDDTDSGGASTSDVGPAPDNPKFQEAMKACEKDSPMKFSGKKA